MKRVAVTSEAFDVGAEVSKFTTESDGAGAVVSFTGVVRQNEVGDLTKMEIEHYPQMTERAIEGIVDQAMDRWTLENVLVIHRHGVLELGEAIMMVATASKHRAEAFAAAEFLMDYLKSRAPFWKKEVTEDGASWVDAKGTDEDALNRW